MTETRKVQTKRMAQKQGGSLVVSEDGRIMGGSYSGKSWSHMGKEDKADAAVREALGIEPAPVVEKPKPKAKKKAKAKKNG